MSVAGNPEVEAASDLELNACCAPGASECGITNTIKWEQEQTVSWSDTFTQKLDFKFTIKVLTTDIELSNSYTNGQSTTRTLEIDSTLPCHAPSPGFPVETFVQLTSAGALYNVPVNIVVEHCGIQQTISGTVSATVLRQNWNCVLDPCTAGCNPDKGCNA